MEIQTTIMVLIYLGQLYAIFRLWESRRLEQKSKEMWRKVAAHGTSSLMSHTMKSMRLIDEKCELMKENAELRQQVKNLRFQGSSNE